MLNLSAATIVLLGAAPCPRAATFATMLQTEVYKRTAIRWSIGNSTAESAAALGSAAAPTITLSTRSAASVDWASATPEGYVLTTSASGGGGVSIVGADERGLLYGVGRLLRLTNMSLTENYYDARRVSVSVAAGLRIASHPDRPMRGLQMGYRPKTNSYDGLTPELFEAYVVDLATFGANQIELIPHSFDDAPYSPHFFLGHDEMNVAMSKTLDKYGLNVSLWYPACNPALLGLGCPKGDYNNATVMAAAKADWHRVFSSSPRIEYKRIPATVIP